MKEFDRLLFLSGIITEKYDKNHECKTPGAIYKTKITDNSLKSTVELPKSVILDLDEDEAEDLESAVHYALEKVLAKFFK